MPALRNPRYELVAKGVAAGLSQLKACIAAGYGMRSHAPANRIVHRPEVQGRIRELLKLDDAARDARDEVYTRAKTGTITGQLTRELLIVEWMDNLQRARALGAIREANACMKALTALQCPPEKKPDRPTKGRKAQDHMAEKEDDVDDEPAPHTGGAREISEIDSLLQRLDCISGDDAEAPTPTTGAGADNPVAVDGDVGAGKPASGA